MTCAYWIWTFFLSDPRPLAPPGERPEESCAQLWSDEEVIRFLEAQCGLSTERPVPGAIFDTHDKALDFWLARLAQASLSAPFEVVHVDAHSDLAFGLPGTNFVLNAVLSRQPSQRAITDTYRTAVELDEAERSALCVGLSLDRQALLRAQSEVASGRSPAAAGRRGKHPPARLHFADDGGKKRKRAGDSV